MKRSIFSKQSARMLAVFKANPNTDISALKLHRAGSGKPNGFLASISRRLSDLRAQGHRIILSRREMKDGVVHTWYKLVTTP